MSGSGEAVAAHHERAGRLEGEVAIITGSSAGLGLEVARLFAREGASVVLTGRNRERGEARAAELAGLAGHVAFVAADLSIEDDCAALVAAACERFGGLSVLVNNAYSSDAIGGDAPLAELTTSAWMDILQVNLTAAMWMARFAINEMSVRRRGSIVNVSARAAERGTPGMAAHAATKGALNALTRSIAVDYASVGIRCNAVVPGHILHAERDATMSEDRRRLLEGMHLTRLATALDIAYGILYLASRESEIVTGIVLPLDGGSMSARALTLGGPDPRRSGRDQAPPVV